MDLRDKRVPVKHKVSPSPVRFCFHIPQAEIKHYSWDHPVSLTNRYRKEWKKDYQIYYRT